MKECDILYVSGHVLTELCSAYTKIIIICTIFTQSKLAVNTLDFSHITASVSIELVNLPKRYAPVIGLTAVCFYGKLIAKGIDT